MDAHDFIGTPGQRLVREGLHPWQSARDAFEATLALLQQHGLEIGQASAAGDALAGQIIGHYKMLCRSFDPVTAMLLREELSEWLDARGVTP